MVGVGRSGVDLLCKTGGESQQGLILLVTLLLASKCCR